MREHLGSVLRGFATAPLLAIVLLSLQACQDTQDAESVTDREQVHHTSDTSTSQTSATDSVVIVQVATRPTTVLALLIDEHEVEFTSSRMGAFVEVIDSVAGSAGWFWMYAVNGTAGQKAADKYELKPGDTVTWAFRKAQ